MYRYFDLSDDEIAIIEKTMCPLNLSGNDDVISDFEE